MTAAAMLLLPASVPLDAPRVASELTQYLEDHWVPIIERRRRPKFRAAGA